MSNVRPDPVVQVNTFPIEPGSKLQVLTFAGDILGSEHLYIHVSGQPEWRNQGIGAGDGPLAFRPKHYVPIKAPVYDEVKTRQLRDFYDYQSTSTDPTDKPAAIYQWPYRPEMQFSVYDLKVKRILATNEEDGFIELLKKERPGVYYGDTIDVFFDMLSANEDALAYFGGGHDFILNIGGHEILFNPDTLEQQLNVLDTRYLSQLSYEDYLTLSFYRNNDAENILWEFGFVINGLHVYYQLPNHVNEKTGEPKAKEITEHLVKDEALTQTESEDEPPRIVQNLGGMRLKYTYKPPLDTEIKTITWQFGQAGWVCKNAFSAPNTPDICQFVNAKTDIDRTPDGTDNNCQKNECGFWWQAAISDTNKKPNWALGQNTKANYSAKTIHPETKKEDIRTGWFKVVTREIGPDMKEPKGSDILMLEGVLWQLGVAPNANIKGEKGVRIEKGRENFILGCEPTVSGCAGTKAINGTQASTEMMIWRFKYPNEIDGDYPKKKDTSGVDTNVPDQTKDFIVTTTKVTTDMIGVLSKQWDDYIVAYLANQVTPLSATEQPASYQSWLESAVNQWNGTYTASLNSGLNTLVGNTGLTREKLLSGWIKKESEIGGITHWGLHGDKYRLMSGSADSFMSLGFSQIQSRYLYGLDPVSNTCTALHRNNQSTHNRNIMRPDKNIEALVVWTAEKGCGVSIRNALFSENFNGDYLNTGDVKILQAKYGVKEDTLLFNKNAVSPFDDGDYEAITKGIAGYNQGGSDPSRWNEFSLPEMYKIISNNCNSYKLDSEIETKRRCVGFEYAIKVKKNIPELPLVDYLWQVSHPNPSETEPVQVCFMYGETLWLNRIYDWEKIKLKAINDEPLTSKEGDPSVRVACPSPFATPSL